jgi:hypothetical protein
LGGLFGQSSERRATKQARKWAIEDQEQQFVRHRAASELAGFNPLATLGFSGAGMVGQTTAGGGNYMGDAIADAAMIAADAVARRSDAGKLSDVQAQNRALNQKVQSLTLRPKIGGIYAQRGVTPNLKQALGVADGAGVYRGVSDAPSRGGVRLAFSKEKSVPVPFTPAVQEYVTTAGTTLKVPVGPDLDEVLSGVGIEMAGAWDAHASRVYDTGKYTIGGYLNKAAEGFWMLAAPSQYLLGGEKPGEYGRAVKAQRDKAVSRYKRDKAAGKVPPLTYIKPFYQ